MNSRGKLSGLILILIITLVACKANSKQEDMGDSLTAGFDVKGDSIIISDYTPGTWLTDYNAALKFAKSENKAVLMNFTGSDWCIWCKRLAKEVFDQEEFLAYAKKNLVLLKLDYPRSLPMSETEKAQNEALAKKYQIQGFPTIILLNKEGNNIGQTGYQPGGPKSYVEHLKTFIK